MSRRNQRHRRDRRYLEAIERHQAAIEAWVTGTRTAMPGPLELLLRRGDVAEYTEVVR